MGRGNDRDRKHGIGGGGGSHRDNERGDRGGPGQIKRQRMHDRGPMNPEQRFFERIHGINLNELVAKKFELRKFMANTRLYVGNIAGDVNEDEIKELFQPFGELDEVFVNREKNFAFLKLDYRTNAEKARAEIDGQTIKGKPLKVRFAPASVRLKVKNLAPAVSNELLEVAFGVFGDIERALVFVDDKGRSIGEGIVDFTRKNNAVAAHRFCSDRCYFLTSELRPLETELAEMYEMDEGLLEASLTTKPGPGNYGKSRIDHNLLQTREAGPRVAEEGSFEHEYGQKWKSLIAEYKHKELELKNEMKLELDNLHKKMEMERYEYETELLRRQLKQREMDAERHRMEWENRMGGMGGGPNQGYMGGGGDFHGGGGGGGGQGGGGRFGRGGGGGGGGGHQGGGGGGGHQGGGGGGGGGRPMYPDRIPRMSMDQNQGDLRDLRDMPPPDNMAVEDNANPGMNDGSTPFMVFPVDGPNANGGSLAPPPMPPSLMDQLDVPVGPEGQNVTWELGPFASFAELPQMKTEEEQAYGDGGSGGNDGDAGGNSGGGGGGGGGGSGGGGGGGPGRDQVFRDRPRGGRGGFDRGGGGGGRGGRGGYGGRGGGGGGGGGGRGGFRGGRVMRR